MKEILELRINYDYANLLFKEDEGKNLGTSARVIELTKEDPRYDQISVIENQVQKKYGKRFYFGWEIKRKYSKKELETAKLLHMKIKTAFEPAGEECGTVYDEATACKICGANRKQVTPLKLKKGSVPKKDIARTIAGELVVSEKFVAAFKKRGLKGAILEPVLFEKGPSNYFQLVALSKVELSQKTVVGINPFNLSTGSEGEIYQCPLGHTIGLNLLSEPYVSKATSIIGLDLSKSNQKIGVKRGLIRPESLYLCSQAFRKMVEEEKLKGFNFQIAHID